MWRGVQNNVVPILLDRVGTYSREQFAAGALVAGRCHEFNHAVPTDGRVADEPRR